MTAKSYVVNKLELSNHSRNCLPASCTIARKISFPITTRVLLAMKCGELIVISHKNSLFKQLKLIRTIAIKADLSNRTKGLTSKVVKLLKKTDTPPTTITLSTLRTSAAIFRRVGICA